MFRQKIRAARRLRALEAVLRVLCVKSFFVKCRHHTASERASYTSGFDITMK